MYICRGTCTYREIVMANDATLHVKLDGVMNENLKQLAYNQKKSKGQLVREAIMACYQVDFSGFTLKQNQALSAYNGGFISTGKLATIMGMHVLELREWLNDHGIKQNNSFGDTDYKNA